MLRLTQAQVAEQSGLFQHPSASSRTAWECRRSKRPSNLPLSVANPMDLLAPFNTADLRSLLEE